ncbi:hypothetical protein BJ165DRAFT_1410444 [Panaeolus papilionaceus]|nr:hypothetical protein BJ165DRAFT_1410444 [Panaeolus papilionaceus]
MGLGDQGQRGIRRFRQQHVCNTFCAALGLEGLDCTLDLDSGDDDEQELEGGAQDTSSLAQLFFLKDFFDKARMCEPQARDHDVFDDAIGNCTRFLRKTEVSFVLDSLPGSNSYINMISEGVEKGELICNGRKEPSNEPTLLWDSSLTPRNEYHSQHRHCPHTLTQPSNEGLHPGEHIRNRMDR